MKWMQSGRKLLLLLLLLASLSLPATISAEIVYTVNESQMEIWTKDLYKLKSNNETLQSQLTEQQEKSMLLLEQLSESQTAMTEARASQQKAETSLESFKASWTKYEKQSKRTEQRLRHQRNVWIVFAGIALCWAANK